VAREDAAVQFQKMMSGGRSLKVMLCGKLHKKRVEGSAIIPHIPIVKASPAGRRPDLLC